MFKTHGIQSQAFVTRCREVCNITTQCQNAD